MNTVRMNQDLQMERSKATFVVERITNMLDDGRTSRRRQLEELIRRDPTGVFDNTNNMYLHRTERYIRSLAKHVRLIELCRMIGIGNKYNGQIIEDPDFVLLLSAIADDLPTSLHWIMFVPNMKSLFTNEQLKEFMPLIRDWKMIGCYAQTELGHGSNVRALETTATFHRDGDDGHFVIHSPTVTSAKFWPGTLGRTANHAMVIARLIDGDGIDRGIHNFLVPLRSMNNHTLLPGVTTGDIGPKIGYNTMDNGYAYFNKVKIPRRYMAMKFAVVNRNGKYSTITSKNVQAASKVAYITMMQVRAYIVNEAGKNLAIACTISIRYSAVRRQGYNTENNNTDGTENQILDYKQQQHRLLPLLASSYCFFFMGKHLLKRLKEIEDCLLYNKAVVTKQDVTDIHASSSALKSYTTTVTADGIEDCRKACGGHGFLQCSGLPELLTTYLQNPTVEGDNHMLPQQVVKVLLKLVQAVVADEELGNYKNCSSYDLIPSIQAILQSVNGSDTNNYNTRRSIVRTSAQSRMDWMDLELVLLPAFRHRVSRLLVEIANQMERDINGNGTTSTGNVITPERAWNNALIEMSRCSKAYAQYLLLQSFVAGIHEVHTNNIIGTTEVVVLQDLARLLGLYWIERDVGDYLEDGYITQMDATYIRTNVLYQLDIIRPNAVALVDARDFSDYKLKSALGRYDGNVYPEIIQTSKADPLNQQEPGPGYEEHLKRLIVDGVGKYYDSNSSNACTTRTATVDTTSTTIQKKNTNYAASGTASRL